VTTKSLGLPDRVDRALGALLAALESKLEGDLVAVLAHGSAVRGGYDEARSDVDLVVVIERDDLDRLERIAPDVALARTSARIECMILRRSEIARAADVFPLSFDDLGAEGVVLWGNNPFLGLRFDDEHRRLRIEQELRNARIRLRVGITDASAGLLDRAALVAQKLRQIRSPLYALLRRAGKLPSRDLKSVIAAAGAQLGVDTTALFRARESPRPALRLLAELLDAAIAHIDDSGTEAARPAS
jgi:predicted nucleotidyltransferase